MHGDRDEQGRAGRLPLSRQVQHLPGSSHPGRVRGNHRTGSGNEHRVKGTREHAKHRTRFDHRGDAPIGVAIVDQRPTPAGEAIRTTVPAST